MNRNSSALSRTLALVAMTMAMPAFAACSGGGSQSLVPPVQSAIAPSMVAHTVGCTVNCAATLLEPLHASFAGGVVTFSAGSATYCNGAPANSGYATVIGPGPRGGKTTVSEPAVSLAFSCGVSSSTPYYIVMTTSNNAGSTVSATPIDGPAVLQAYAVRSNASAAAMHPETRASSLQFSAKTAQIPSSQSIYFFLAACPTCM
jgi:hypothetical protein